MYQGRNPFNTNAHSGVSHTGIPGVGDLTTAAHSGIDHAGFTGVPAAEAFDATAHSSEDHLGITGTSGLTKLTFSDTSISGPGPIDILPAIPLGTFPTLGYTVPVDGQIEFVIINNDGAIGVTTYEVTVNGTVIGAPLAVDSAGFPLTSPFTISPPVAFSAGNLIGFRYISATGSESPICHADVWVRLA